MIKLNNKRFFDFFIPILIIALTLFYACVSANQTMPYAEGWYTYYAKLINSGHKVYKDFDYLFTPFYIYFIAFFTKIFGYKIIALRILGAILFAGISITLYLTLKELFPKWIAGISTIIAVFYMQSEIVQIYYDYIRFMDFFVLLSALFFLKAMKCEERDKVKYLFFFLSGLSTACILLIKQNTGGVSFIFFVLFSIVFSLCIRKKIIIFIRELSTYIIGFLIPLLLTFVIFEANGMFADFVSQIAGDAVSAKGGLQTLLFNWMFNNSAELLNVNVVKTQIIIYVLVAFGIFIKRRDLFKIINTDKTDKIWNIVGILFLMMLLLIYAIATKSIRFASVIFKGKDISPYTLFMIVFGFFIVGAIVIIYRSIKKQKISDSLSGIFLLISLYVAISESCGMSGGLAQGQATLGLAVIVAILLELYSNRRFLNVIAAVVVIFSFIFTLNFGLHKWFSTYNWWGMTQPMLWESSESIKGIDVLSGIKVSEDTKNVYEKIAKEIQNNTDKNDSIYCFPQVPIFYNVCDRMDPGVRAPVEWFDVVSDKSCAKDIKTISKKKPGAILICNVPVTTYDAHERLFRNERMSGTKKIREFLYDYVNNNNYKYIGKYVESHNSFSLWIRQDDSKVNASKIFDGGNGTLKSPYLISSAEQLKRLSKMVNESRSFSGQYIKQTADIDMQGEEFTPIGDVNPKVEAYAQKHVDDGSKESIQNSFNGTYDGNGHVINNLYIKNDYAGLFGYLGGTVCNLGIENCNIIGKYSAGIAYGNSDDNASIINCWTSGSISGERAGGIADKYNGYIKNSYSTCILSGTFASIKSNHQYGFDESRLDNCYIDKDNIKSEIEARENSYMCSDKFMKNKLITYMNEWVTNNYDAVYADKKIKVLKWTKGAYGYPALFEQRKALK